MTVILGWNSLRTVHAPWTHQALAKGHHGLGTPPSIAECRIVTRAGGGPGAASAPQPCLSSGIPPIPAPPFAPHASQHRQAPLLLQTHIPTLSWHTPATAWVGSPWPCARRIPWTSQLFGFSWLQSSPMTPFPSLCWQWPFLSTSKCHMRLEVRCCLSHHNSKSSPVSQGWGNIFATTWGSIKMIKNITNDVKSYQPNKKQGEVLSIAAYWSANLSSNRNTAEQLILRCLCSLWGSFPNLVRLFLGRGGLVAEQTNHAQKGIFPQVQVHQNLICQAQQTTQILHKWYVYVLHPDMWHHGLVPTATMQSTHCPGLWQELREKCTEYRWFTSWWEGYMWPYLNRPTNYCRKWIMKSQWQFWPLLWLRHLDMLLVPVWGRQCKLQVACEDLCFNHFTLRHPIKPQSFLQYKQYIHHVLLATKTLEINLQWVEVKG